MHLLSQNCCRWWWWWWIVLISWPRLWFCDKVVSWFSFSSVLCIRKPELKRTQSTATAVSQQNKLRFGVRMASFLATNWGNTTLQNYLFLRSLQSTSPTELSRGFISRSIGIRVCSCGFFRHDPETRPDGLLWILGNGSLVPCGNGIK